MKYISICLLAFFSAFALNAKIDNQKLWEGKAPGEICSEPEELKSVGILKYTNVSVPEMVFFPIESAQPAPTVIVCPGGGYKVMAWDLEGTEIAKWLNSEGFNAIVLKYRVPDNKDGAFADLQRAIRLARFNAAKWNIDPNRLGVLGFSAGGHLIVRASANYNISAYEAHDEADKLSARPDFTVAVYPAYLSLDENYAFPEDLKVDKNAPRAFIIAAQDDRWVDSSIAYYLTLKKIGVKADLHLFSEGGHGTGIRKKEDSKPMRSWNNICGVWLKYYFGNK